jgi:hypothetical protein
MSATGRKQTLGSQKKLSYTLSSMFQYGSSENHMDEPKQPLIPFEPVPLRHRNDGWTVEAIRLHPGARRAASRARAWDRCVCCVSGAPNARRHYEHSRTFEGGPAAVRAQLWQLPAGAAERKGEQRPHEMLPWRSAGFRRRDCDSRPTTSAAVSIDVTNSVRDGADHRDQRTCAATEWIELLP